MLSSESPREPRRADPGCPAAGRSLGLRQGTNLRSGRQPKVIASSKPPQDPCVQRPHGLEVTLKPRDHVRLPVFMAMDRRPLSRRLPLLQPKCMELDKAELTVQDPGPPGQRGTF